MVETILLLWGKNDDGQLGNRWSSCGSPSHASSQSREQQPTDDIGKPAMMSSFRPAFVDSRGRGDCPPPPSRGVTRSAMAGSSSNDAFAWSATPSRVLSGLVVSQVSCGSRHTLARVEGGAAYSWGWGACGQLGHGDDHGAVVPREIEALKTGTDDMPGGAVAWVSAGGIHSAAVLEGGRVFTWGGSSYGQLGLGPAVTTKGMQALPGKVMLSETESPTGSPRAESGSTGLTRHSSMTQKAAVLAMESAPKIELLAEVVVCGGMHTAALTAEGVVYCWGRADSGQLGIGAEWVHETSSGVMGVEWPRRVRGLLEGRKTASIACGGFHTAAVTTDGECYTWGKEDYGMLGCSNESLLQANKGGLFRPHRVTLQVPANMPDNGSAAPTQEDNGGDDDHRRGQHQKVKAVACGGWHTAIIGDKGGVWTCGRGEYGRLGLGDQKSQWQLTPVPLEKGRAASTSAAPTGSTRHMASADTTSTTAAAKGFGGHVDDPTDHTAVTAGTPPPPPPMASTKVETGNGGPAVRTTDPAAMVALGGSHSMVMTASGRVFSFGRQDDGRLGLEATVLDEIDTGNPFPEEIPSLQLDGWRVKSISAGGVHSAAILTRQA